MKAINIRVAVALEELRDAVLARSRRYPELTLLANRAVGRLFVDSELKPVADRVEFSGDELRKSLEHLTAMAVVYAEARAAAPGAPCFTESIQALDACRKFGERMSGAWAKQDGRCRRSEARTPRAKKRTGQARR